MLRSFRTFIQEFKVEALEDDENMLHLPESRQQIDINLPYYLERLYEISAREDQPFLSLNLAHVKSFSEALYRKIVAYPAVSST